MVPGQATRWAVGSVGQIVAEAVKTELPEAAPLGDPGLGRPQRRRVDAAGPRAADLRRPDQAAGLQHLHVLEDRCQGHRQRLAEFAHRSRSLAKPIYHQPPARVGQGLEDPVQISQLVNHVLEYEPEPIVK